MINKRILVSVLLPGLKSYFNAKVMNKIVCKMAQFSKVKGCKPKFEPNVRWRMYLSQHGVYHS